MSFLVRELPDTEHPVAKAARYGIEILSEWELLTVLLGSRAKEPALSATRLLETFGNLRQMSRATVTELTAVPGIGPARALEIKACLELARRFSSIQLKRGEYLGNSRQVFAHYHERLRDYKKERFYCILLDSKHKVIREELVSIGSLNLSIVHPREVFAPAIREAAQSILLVHNHPSGDPTPSQEDLEVTRRLKKTGEVVGIGVLDHIIIGNGCYVSFVEQGLT